MPNPVSALNKIKNMFSPLERTIIAHKMESMPSSQWAAYIKANAPKAAKKEALAIKLDELLARQPKISKQEIVKHIQEKSPKVNVIEKGDMKLNAAESKELDELKQKASKYMFGDDAAITDDEFLRYNALASRYDNSTVSGLNQKSESYFNSARKAKEKGNWSDELFDNRQGEFYKRRADALNAAPVDGNKTKFDTYTLPGGENYKEVILSLPQKPMSFDEWVNYNMPGARNPERYRENYDNYLASPDVMSSKETFKSGHYDEPNILAHLRMNDRSTAEGKRALFLEELQSDWAQQGRKEGFLRPDLHVERRAEIKAEMDELANEIIIMRQRGESIVDVSQRLRQLDDALRDIPTPKGVPSGPYVGDTADWTGLGLKKAIERAVEQGHDSIAWTSGAQQAKRYDLSKDINEVHYSGSNLKAYDHDGNEVVSQTGISPEDLPEYIGKDAAEKLLAQQPQGTLRSLRGQDLQVGGEGMRGYYDQIVPSTANDILKSMGVTERVKPIGVQLGNNVSEQMGFEITPEIRDYVLNQGLPAFAGGGVVKAAAKGLREMAEQYMTPKAAPAVNRIDMNYKDVTKRVDDLAKAAIKLDNGELTASEYDKLVNSLKPVTPYSFVPAPATYEDAMRALDKNKKLMYGKTSEIPAGERTDLRLDIPAYTNHGVWVNSIHRKNAPTVYDSVSSVKNATMIGSPDKALKVAKGGPKGPFAVIRGEWNPISQEDAVKTAQENLASGEWIQVGYDPERHGYFYDRSTMEPVAGAEEILQIGPLVIAKNPAYAAKAEQKFGAGGVVKAAAKGLRGMADRYQLAHEAAQKNAVKMLGLPPNNTAMDRAKALGFNTERTLYHGTDANDFNKFNPMSFFSNNPKEASAYAQVSDLVKKEKALKKYNINPKVINVKKEVPYSGILSDILTPKVGKLYATDNGVFKYRGNDQWDAMSKLDVDYEKSKNTDLAFLKKSDNGEALNTVLEYNQYINDTFPGGVGGRVIPVITSAKNPVEMSAMNANVLGKRLGATDKDIQDTISKYTDLGFDSIKTTSDEATFYPEVRDALGGIPEQEVIFNPSQLRSPFAAFDPMRRNENDTLAGVGVGLPVSGMLAEQPLEKAEGGVVHMDEGGLNVRATGDYGNFDSEGSSGSHYNFSTDVDILNKYGFGVTKEGQVFKMPERTYTYEDGYTETVPARKIKRDDISELRARYTTDDGVQYGVGRQPLAKGWSGYRTDPRTQATIGVNVSPEYKNFSAYRSDPRSQSSVGVNVSPYYKGINYTKNFAEGGKVSDPFANLSILDKAKLLAKAAKYRVQYNKQAVDHGKYPDALSSELKKNYLDQVGNSRVNRSPLDVALNYGGGYDFGVRQDIPADVARDMGKAYQYTDYFFSPFTGPKSDAVGDYYENMAGVEAGIKERGRRATEAEIQRRSAEYGKRSSKMLPQYEEPNYAEGGAVETDDFDYDEMYEFKKDEPAFAEGGEVDYDTMYEFKDNTVGFAKGGPVLSVGRGEKLPVAKGAGLTAKGRAKYNAATGSNLKAPAPHPKTDADAGRRKSFCARMSGMPGPMKDEQGNPTRKAASLKRWNC